MNENENNVSENNENENNANENNTNENNTNESSLNENNVSEPESAPENESESPAEPEAPKAPETPRAPQAPKNTALHVSSILSAFSIVLLVALALSLMLGIIPTGSGGASYQPPVNSTPTSPDTDADPDLIEDFLSSVVVIKANGATTMSTGTGVIISTDGYIVTNYHVIEGGNVINVNLYGEKTAEKATVVGFHKEDDVAVLKINRTDLRAASFVDSNVVRYGEKVYAIGTPEGSDFGWSVTQGIVSSPRRQLMIYDDEGVLEKKMNVVQTDASVNHGNSGGPLINVRGEIVGIVTLKRSDSAGMGFALPSNGVLALANAIIAKGNADGVNSGISVPRPLLGITGVGVLADTYYENYTTQDGTAIREVDSGYALTHPSTTFYAGVAGVHVSAISESADAGKSLKVDDIITEINGNSVSTIYHVMDIINEYNGGDAVTVKYYRDGKYYTAEVTLGSAR